MDEKPKTSGHLKFTEEREFLSTNMFENHATKDCKHRLRCLNSGTYSLKPWLKK